MTADAAIPHTQAWMDEIIEAGCYRCGHDASEDDPCDEMCEGLPMSWSELQAVSG